MLFAPSLFFLTCCFLNTTKNDGWVVVAPPRPCFIPPGVFSPMYNFPLTVCVDLRAFASRGCVYVCVSVLSCCNFTVRLLPFFSLSPPFPPRIRSHRQHRLMFAQKKDTVFHIYLVAVFGVFMCACVGVCLYRQGLFCRGNQRFVCDKDCVMTTFNNVTTFHFSHLFLDLHFFS